VDLPGADGRAALGVAPQAHGFDALQITKRHIAVLRPESLIGNLERVCAWGGVFCQIEARGLCRLQGLVNKLPVDEDLQRILGESRDEHLRLVRVIELGLVLHVTVGVGAGIFERRGRAALPVVGACVKLFHPGLTAA